MSEAKRKLREEEAILRLAQQLYLRGDRQSVNLQLMLMDAFVRAMPFYLLKCNISDEAALLSYSTLSNAPKKN